MIGDRPLVYERLPLAHSIEVGAALGDTVSRWRSFDWRSSIASCASEPHRVEFQPLTAERTAIAVRGVVAPGGWLGRIRDRLGITAADAVRDLARFKASVEAERHRHDRRSLRAAALDQLKAQFAGSVAPHAQSPLHPLHGV